MAKKTLDRPRPQSLKIEPDAPLRGGRKKLRDHAQPQLPLDPMPSRIEPCLALLASKPPEGPAWGYEVKWDGYRVAVHAELGGKVRILTRGGHDWADRFPTIAKAVRELGPGTMILDGVAVILDEQGQSDFNLLVASLGGRGGKKVSSDTVQLDAIGKKRPTVRVKAKSAVYVEPVIAAEIEYRAWTGDGKLRHASFKGIRDVADEIAVYEVEG